jgi:hypothetical protein
MIGSVSGAVVWAGVDGKEIAVNLMLKSIAGLTGNVMGLGRMATPQERGRLSAARHDHGGG